MKKIVIFFLLLAIFGILSARSKLKSTIKAELRKPGVKLVAIDFYMTGCPPCDAAITEWKKLKKQYGDALKLIVVAPVRDNGSCMVKDWRPDKMICDEDMEIAGRWGVKDFPQAFLYSWCNNDPLVQLGHVKDVEKAIKAYFKKIPRVVLDADSNSRNLVPKVEEALKMNSKIELVSSAAEQKQLLALKEQSHQRNYDENLKCELGKQISANSVLKITKEDGDLVLRLLSVEESCTRATATKSLSGDKQKLKTEVAAAVYELLSQIFDNISTPDESAKPAKTQMPVVQSTNSPDSKACEYARNKDTIEMWEKYLKKFPNGECSFEAESKIEEIEKKNREEQLKKATNSDEKLRIAVMEFEDQTEKLPKKILQDANEYIYSAFINSNKYIVVADAKKKDSIREKRKKMLHSGQNISLGKEISAQTILRPKIISFAGKYTVFFELIDLEKSAIMNGFKETFDGNEKSFSVAVKNIVAKFLDASTNIAFDKKPIIAITDFDGRNNNLPKKTIENATEYMRNNIICLNKYIVTPQNRETAIIKKYKVWALNSDSPIKNGVELPAQTIFRTEITSFGGKYSITSTFIDPAKKVVVSGAKAIFDGSERSLLLAIDNIAELFEKNNYPTEIVNLDKPVISIRDFEDKTGNLSKKMLENAVEYIQNAFFSSNHYIIVPTGNANTIISKICQEIKKKSYNLAYDENFKIPLAQDISTNNFLFTKISFSANRYLISSELIDIEQAFTLKSANATFDGTEESLAKALDNIVEQITR